jgi:branched-subunit amino acid transport protein
MNEILLITGMAIVTYFIRVIIFPISSRMALPPAFERALRYVPPAVLTAIIFPAVLIPGGSHLDLSFSNAHLVGAALAAGVGWFSKNLLLTIICGMAGFWAWQYGLRLISI